MRANIYVSSPTFGMAFLGYIYNLTPVYFPSNFSLPIDVIVVRYAMDIFKDTDIISNDLDIGFSLDPFYQSVLLCCIWTGAGTISLFATISEIVLDEAQLQIQKEKHKEKE